MDVTEACAHFLMLHSPAALGRTAIGSSQIVMLALAIGGLTILMISTYRRTRQSRLRPYTSARELYARAQKEPGVKRDVEQIMLELDQLARQIHGRIDTRFAKLEAVIRDADERIDTLSRLTRASQGDATVDVTMKSEDIPQLSSPPGDTLESRHATVYRLADDGRSPAEIGQKVGKTSGEVELILALRRVKTNSDN